MTTVRPFKLDDFEVLVDMYYAFNKEVYPNRRIGQKYFFYKAIQEWVAQGADIVMSVVDDNLSGFSMCYEDDFGHLTQSVYQCDICYVKERYRKGRSAYMLYNNSYTYAKEKGLIVNVSARVENKVDKLVGSHFDLTETFKTFEG